MILITTGRQGRHRGARLLAQRGQPVRIQARDPKKVNALAQAGVDVVEGDLEDPASIDAATRGVPAVVLVSPAIPIQELNVIGSAARADVGHVVNITSKAANSWQRAAVTSTEAAFLRLLATVSSAPAAIHRHRVEVHHLAPQ